ncbi:hypothetical protein SLNSH_20780 [Alsobacter soli]|uniref:Uncharacterized protein n=1 Tax=Alsobacter soli TaxID=2109933 RepID=A0A2T1HN43_9HYPH|nr:hypothetical protein [Alsobacter soli]PSC03062.1 hypothetical protein SLNSH_20780 [Alsobacter soli]
MLKRLFPVLALLLVQAETAHADWRYCLAVNEADHTAAMTQAFQSSQAMDDIEKAFEAWLRSQKVAHSRVLCPRAADQAAIERDRAHAATYNAKVGNHVNALTWNTGAPSSF